MILKEITTAIQPVDQTFYNAARIRTEQLLMPTRAMGRLHEIAERLCAIGQTERPEVNPATVIVMAGDHGITKEGVSAYPAEITGMMVQTFISGGATINALARQAGVSVTVVDMGIAADIPAKATAAGRFVVHKIAAGTANFAKGPAMTRDQGAAAVTAGYEEGTAAIKAGARLIATGDMGIGNTTPSTAIGAVFTGRNAVQMTGRGTGVNDEGLAHKTAVINAALARHRPDVSDGLDVLSTVGGFEIGGIAGLCLAAAVHRVPVVIDGIISTAGALIAKALAPACTDYMFAGHCSFEQGHRPMLACLNLEPLLDLGMRLGEGTGAVLAINLIRAAAAIHTEVLTFKDIGIEKGQ